MVGAALGALVTGEKKGTAIAALVGAAVYASFMAFQRAKKTGIPVLYEEDRVLYREFPDGTREVVKKMPHQKEIIPSSFTLE